MLALAWWWQLLASGMLLVPAAACPGSPVPAGQPHDSASVRVTFPDDSCAAVRQELLARVHGLGGWVDPHSSHGAGTNGVYTLLSEPAASVLMLSRRTADDQYTDLLDFAFSANDGGGCVLEGCSESQVPSVLDFSTNFCNLHDLYCGLADGCPTAGGRDLQYEEEIVRMGARASHNKPTCVRALTGTPPLTRFVSQRQDHFDRQNSNRWQQRFMVNDTFFLAAADSGRARPVFLCVGGEGPALKPEVVLSGTVHCALMVAAAKEMGALILALEHRYYGDSIPVPDFSTANLRFLSSQQALADIASFHAKITALYNLTPEDNRWVSFGGSYPGMLAAWARREYPHLIYASIASSAPVQAQLTMPEYGACGYNPACAHQLCR